jgi:hypothetical protein
VLQVILKVFIIMLYENVFQNPELFPRQSQSLSRAFYFIYVLFLSYGPRVS